MSRVITFSRFFPATHPKKGQPTFFVEQLYNSIGLKIGTTKQSGNIPQGMWELVNDFVLLDGSAKKHHTIRSGNRWKVGDWFSPRVWSGRPYASKQIIIAPDIEIKKVWEVVIMNAQTWFAVKIDGKEHEWQTLSENDGLSGEDFIDWFKKGNIFRGQILCWNENIDY